MQPKPSNQPPLRAVPMKVFPTLDSLDDVVALAQSKLPIIDRNELMSLLMTYHNTLLHELQKGTNHG